MKTRILQLTDLHVFSTAGERLKGIPTRESLQEVVAYIEKTEEPFDYVIVTGDHTHDERPESYQAVVDALSPWSDRLHQVPGNHDDRSLMKASFSLSSNGLTENALTFGIEAGEWLLLGLDTHVPGKVAGHIDDAQIAWLRETLATSTAKSVALFFHHPPVDVGSVWMDAIGLNNRDSLNVVVESDSRVRLISCGHVHHEFEFALGNARVFTTPSTGIQFDPKGETPRFAEAAPGYRVFELTADTFQTHVVRLPTIKYTPIND